MLMSLAKQDGKIDEDEVQVIIDAIGADRQLLTSSANVDIMDAINTVNGFTNQQKLEFAIMVVKVIEADGFVHPQEAVLAGQYFKLTGIDTLLNK